MKRVEIKREPVEDRSQPGTKADREHKLPLPFIVRYRVLMAAIAVVATAAGVAWRNTEKLSTQGHNQAVQGAELQQLAMANHRLAVQNRRLTLRVARDEHKTCLIQQRGLPAGHDLAAAMADIHGLLTLPSTQTPPPAVAVIVADLNGELSAYLKLEGQQPPSRRC